MEQISPTQRLADVLLGDDGPLEAFVAKRRDEHRSWRLISRDLYEAVQVDVTGVTLRAWFGVAGESDGATEMAS